MMTLSLEMIGDRTLRLSLNQGSPFLFPKPHIINEHHDLFQAELGLHIEGMAERHCDLNLMGLANNLSGFALSRPDHLRDSLTSNTIDPNGHAILGRHLDSLELPGKSHALGPTPVPKS
jgi:hypothetical protein